MMRYDNLIMPDKARKAAATLKQYCEQNGCLYCCFHDKDLGVCNLIHHPRNYPEDVIRPSEGGKHYA